jgi:hypothetical protein
MKIFCALVGLLALNLADAEEPSRLVMSWVPPYAVAKSVKRLEETYDGAGMATGLTHLGLQFWTPTSPGGIERLEKETNDDAVRELLKWGHAHGVRVLLCVYNGAKKWDWPLARAGFAEHPQAFATALISEMERLQLDGVDLDLEGNGRFEEDKEAYVRFVADLSRRLHEKGKHLTADSFAYAWNAPNQGWWKELFPLLDGLTSMGYEEIGSSASEWRAYAAQVAAAGDYAAKFVIGMPADKKAWQGAEAIEHLNWVRANGRAGVAIWDAQLGSEAWRVGEVWRILADIRGGSELDEKQGSKRVK